MTTKNALVLTSWGKNAGGGHLLRVKKLTKLLQSQAQSTTQTRAKHHTKPSKIDFTFLNSEAQSNIHNDKSHKKTWQDICEFRALIAKYSLIIIDSYELQSRHYQALLRELDLRELESSQMSFSKKDFAKSILILDDEVSFLRFIAQILQKAKHTPQNLVKLSNALRHIFVLNGGLASQKLLRDFKKDFTTSFGTNLAYAPDFRDFAKSSERLLHDFIKNNVFYGVKYFVANAEFDFARDFQRKRIKHILLTFGASDKQNYTQKTINALSQMLGSQKYSNIFDSKVCAHIVLGEFYPHHFAPKSIKKSTANFPKIKIYQNLPPKDFARVMKHCDIAISAGGQSLYEISQSALPLVIIPTATNQLSQSSAFAKKKGAILLDVLSQDLPLQASLSQALLTLTPKKRAKLSQNLKKLHIGKSAKKIAHRFLRS